MPHPGASPLRRMVGGPVQSPRALEQAQRLALRSMDRYVEIVRPGKAGVGMSEPDTPPYIGGRVRARLQRGSRTMETAQPVIGVVGDFEWEWALPLGVSLSGDDRLAWPAYFPLRASGAEYKAGDLVAPKSWINGSTPYFRCIQSGVSAAGEPEFPTKLNQVAVDGTVKWQLVGWATLFEITSILGNHSDPNEVIVSCKEKG